MRKLTVLAISAATAIVVFLACYAFRAALGYDAEADALIDKLLLLQADRADLPASTVPFVAMDFDDATFFALGWPSAVPRNALADSIERAVRSGARLIVVDTDVGWETTPEQRARIEAAIRASEQAGIPTLLMREVFRPDDGKAPGVLASTPYDRQVAQSKFVRFAGVPILSEPDGVARRLLPLQQICIAGKAKVLPSVHVLAAAALAVPSRGMPFRETDQTLGTDVGPCGKSVKWRRMSANVQTLGGNRRFDIEDDDMRVLYRMSWILPEGVVRPTIQASISTAASKTGPGNRPRPVLLRISENDLPPGTEQVSALRGAIAIIGSSAAIERDMHPTPLGPMPGMGILANAIGQTTISPIQDSSPWYVRWALRAPPLLVGLLFTAFTTVLTWGLFMLSHKFARNHVLLDETLRLLISVFWVGAAWLLLSGSVILDVAAPQFVATSVLFILAGQTKKDHR